MPSSVVVFSGAFFALMGLWGLNHDDAVGSAGGYTSWLSPRSRVALAAFVTVAGCVLCLWGALL